MVPQRKEGESELDYLRRKEVAMGLWQGEALERIHELEAQLQSAVIDRDKYRLALKQINDALFIVGKYANTEAHEIEAEDFARDFAPWRNIMALHDGKSPLAKPKRGKK